MSTAVNEAYESGYRIGFEEGAEEGSALRDELLGALMNVMGHVDTPIGRRRLRTNYSPEWLSGARAVLAKYRRK